ncbi:MAG: PIN/TRAM domain-containing protein [Sphaerimonospora mesophila]
METTFLTIMKLKQRTLKVARGSLLLDTSAIIDGRIVDVAKTGVITAELIVPRSVINELQLLADKADHDKRSRARAGLENVRELQRMETVAVTIVNDGRVGSGGVDERLLELAKNYDASIATTDYNLNKVAKVVGITVVNVNELAQMLRVQHLPGEAVEIQLIQPGANREQAVGYLDDGTMVVVEDAKHLIGQRLRVEIVRSLQTEAGRMMFAQKAKGTAKPTKSFHSDQLSQPKKKPVKRNSYTKPNQSSNNRNQRGRSSAEDSMVALANSTKDHN